MGASHRVLRTARKIRPALVGELRRLTYEPSEAVTFRQRLLTDPGERREAEYKAALPLGTQDSFTLKLLRQIQGIANGGGGWLVIGFVRGSSGLLAPDPKHSDAVAATFEPTVLSKRANAAVFRGQHLRLTVFHEVHPTTGLRHPIISVLGFERSPFVCRSSQTASDNGELILEQDAVYIRRHGAETSKLCTPEDWDDVISRAVSNRRSETLGELSELLKQMMSPNEAPAPAIEKLEAWTSQAHEMAFR